MAPSEHSSGFHRCAKQQEKAHHNQGNGNQKGHPDLLPSIHSSCYREQYLKFSSGNHPSLSLSHVVCLRFDPHLQLQLQLLSWPQWWVQEESMWSNQPKRDLCSVCRSSSSQFGWAVRGWGLLPSGKESWIGHSQSHPRKDRLVRMPVTTWGWNQTAPGLSYS